MKEKRIQIAALCCALAVLLSLAAAPLVTAAPAELLTGTVHDIYTAADLLEMANSSDTFYLRNDLDLTNFGNWTPINFWGTFDGQGHTIRGIKVSGYTGNAGLFENLSGTVRHLHIDVDIRGNSEQNSYVGGLAGELSATVRCVSVSGRIQMACYNSSSGIHVGGLAGRASGSTNTISSCYSNASVTLTVEGELSNSLCGGLVGGAFNITPCSIINSYATGNVAIVGLPLADRHNANVCCDGLVGGYEDVRRSYFCNFHDTQLTGNGTYLTAEAMKEQSTYVDWDFSTVWDISPTVNDGFPFLRQPETVPPSSVTLDRGALTLGVGNSQMLQATVLPVEATARHLDWYSSDTDVVDLTPVAHSSSGEINARMMVNARAPGVAVVTAVTTEGRIEAACTVTVSDGNAEPLPTYRLNGITIRGGDGASLAAIPSGSFLATVSVTNIASADRPTIMLAAYTAEEQYVGLFYVTLQSPVGGTIEATLPVDNTTGTITQLKAFAVTSLADLTPLGNVVSFPAT